MVLVGASLGGAIALEFALEYPEVGGGGHHGLGEAAGQKLGRRIAAPEAILHRRGRVIAPVGRSRPAAAKPRWTAWPGTAALSVRSQRLRPQAVEKIVLIDAQVGGVTSSA
jgi:pimeloyl-ACP methyl ester carboxylesterase